MTFLGVTTTTTTTTTTPATTNCQGLPGQNSCCTATNPCPLGGGDCDSDSDCQGNLVCGTDNCKGFHPGSYDGADCCMIPEIKTTSTGN